MVSLWSVENAIQEMRRFIEAGLRGVDIWIAPPERLPYSDERYEPFWTAAEEIGATVNMHINGLAEPRERDPAGIPIHSINGHKSDAMNSLLHIIASGVLERHPRLNVAVAEAGAGWVPFWLQEADHYTMSRRSTLPMPPSEYFSDRSSVPSSATLWAPTATGLRARQLHVVERLPSSACTWPDSNILIPEELGGLPMMSRRRLSGARRARVYNNNQPPASPDPPGDRAEIKRWLEHHRNFGASARPKHRAA